MDDNLEEPLLNLNREGLIDVIDNTRLETSQLKNEIQVLKKQYDDAMSFYSKIEEFTEENKTLKRQLTESRLSNDDLQRRLQISQQKISELTDSTEKIKNRVDNRFSDEIADLQMQLDIAKSENVNLNSRYHDEIKKLESSLLVVQSENALYQKQQQKTLFVVGNLFNEKFETPQELFQRLNDLNQLPSSPTKGAFNNKNRQDSNLDEKISELKNKCQSEKQKKKNLEMVIIKLKKKIDQDQLVHEEELTSFKDQLRQQANEIENLKLLNQQKQLPKGPPPPKLRSVGCQNSIFALNENEQIENFKHQMSTSITQIEAQSSHISMLKLQIESLMKQIEESENSKSQLSKKIKSLTGQYNEMEKQYNKQKNENEKLASQFNELKDRFCQDKAEATYPTTQLETKLKIAESNLDIKQKTIDDFEVLMNRQKEEISELSLNKEKLVYVIEKQNEMLNVFNEICHKKSPNAPKITEKIVTVEPKINWPIDYLPEEIVDLCKDITENESMSIESRIKSVFTVINKWINQNLNSYQKELTQQKVQYSELENKCNEFRTKLCGVLSDDQQTKDENEILEYFENIIENLNSTKYELQKMNENQDNILQMANVDDFDSLVQRQEYLSNDNKKLLEKIDSEKKKRASLKKKFISYVEDKEKETEKQREIFQTNKENSRKQIEQLQLGLTELQNQNKNLIEQMKEMNSQTNENDGKEDNHYFHHKNIDDHELLEMSRTQAIHEVEELQEQIMNLEININDWKSAASKANDENTRLKQNTKEMCAEYECQISQLVQKHEIENKQNANTVQELTNKLKAQADDHKIVVDHLNEALVKTNKMYESSIQQTNSLSFLNEKSKAEAISKIEAMERAKKLSEAQLKAKILSLDSNYAVLMEEEKQKAETEKRELIEYFAKSFQSFTDVNVQMDDNAFREMVRNVRASFDKHRRTEDAIRKLIKASDDDSIEDAVTQFIIQNHPQFQGK